MANDPAPVIAANQTPTSKPPTIGQNQAALAKVLKAAGLSDVGIAAFLGNFQVESGFSPTSYNAAENAHGFANWENGRWTALQTYASSKGLDPLTTQAQVGYLTQELSGPYHSVINNLKGVTDVSQAAAIVDQQFEGSAGTTRALRQADAASFLPQVQKLTSGSGGGNSIIGTTADILDPLGLVPGHGGLGFGGVTSDLASGAESAVLGPVHAVKDVAGAVSEVVNALFSPSFWIRTAFVVGGFAMVGIGVRALVGGSAASSYSATGGGSSSGSSSGSSGGNSSVINARRGSTVHVHSSSEGSSE